MTVDTDERVERTQSRPPVAWIWAGIASMVVIVVAVVFWTFSLAPAQLTDNVAIDVPDVVGQTYEDGSKLLDDRNLVAQRFNEASQTAPEGTILRTDPSAGTTVSPGQEIKVYVSSGRPTVDIPDVSRMA